MLETQREENMQLKESLDRMRFDLDEARAAAANQLKVGGVARSETSGSSRPPTLSRNLGDEINRRLMEAAAKASEDGDEVDEDDVVETVVTTRQTRVSFPSVSVCKAHRLARNEAAELLLGPLVCPDPRVFPPSASRRMWSESMPMRQPLRSQSLSSRLSSRRSNQRLDLLRPMSTHQLTLPSPNRPTPKKCSKGHIVVDLEPVTLPRSSTMP